MTPEKNNQTLTRWLLIATIALLVLVLGLQPWQLFGKAAPGKSPGRRFRAFPRQVRHDRGCPGVERGALRQ